MIRRIIFSDKKMMQYLTILYTKRMTDVDLSSVSFFTALAAHYQTNFPQSSIATKASQYMDRYSIDPFIPTIVVIGNEVSGKSILLERLLHIPLFPSDRTCRTQSPISFHLRNSAVISIRFVILENGESIYSFESNDIAELAHLIKQKMSEAGGELTLTKEFRIIYTRPDIANMNIVDMPGFNMHRKDAVEEYLDNLPPHPHAHENGCPWGEETCDWAARKGHLDCLRYALDNDCPCSDEDRQRYLAMLA